MSSVYLTTTHKLELEYIIAVSLFEFKTLRISVMSARGEEAKDQEEQIGLLSERVDVVVMMLHKCHGCSADLCNMYCFRVRRREEAL